MAPSASPLLQRNPCLYCIHFISFSHRSDAFPYNQSLAQWFLVIFSGFFATGANQFTGQTSVATSEFAVDKLKLTLSSAINNPALSMQNGDVLISPKTK